MKITSVKTRKILYPTVGITELLDQCIAKLEEKSIIAITSKVLSICQGNVVKNDGTISKKKLIQKEADYYLEHEPYPGIILTIKNNHLIPSAGIDESNGNGYFILWPKNVQQSTNRIREHLVQKYSTKHIGVIVTDSHTYPMRTGTLGIGLSHSGFCAINDFVGAHDMFGEKLSVTRSNILDGLAASATIVMGETNEQTPFAIISDIPFVSFQNRNPTKKEIDTLHFPLQKDLYAPLLDTSDWKRGK